MATLAKQRNGSWKLYLEHPQHGRRTSITLGKLSKRSAESLRLRVEQLLACRCSGTPWPPELARWVGELSDSMQQKLARVGLVPPRVKTRLGSFLQQWLATRSHYKPSSQVVWRQVVRDLLKFFGQECLLEQIDRKQAEAFRHHLQQRGLSPTTISKRLQVVRMIFRHAVQQELLEKSPFEHVRHHGGDPGRRRVYVPVGSIQKVLQACGDPWWQLLVVLARFAGLRTPSESLSLRWEDIHWEENRMLVHASKTAHLPGRGCRAVPLFPEVRFYLEQARNHAEPQAEYVFPEHLRRRAQGPRGWNGANLRTGLLRIIRRAGLEPWPRPWHNLRASCETDLVQQFPLPKVAKWIGNTAAVAMRHYVDVTDEDFRRAASGASRLATAPAGEPRPTGAPTAKGFSAPEKAEVQASPGPSGSAREPAGRHPLGTKKAPDRQEPKVRNPVRTGHDRSRQQPTGQKETPAQVPSGSLLAPGCNLLPEKKMEAMGLEPTTFALRTRRSPN